MELTRLIRVVTVAAVTASVTISVTVLATVTLAQAQGVPAETPPASYRGDQYVDSRGCAFVRVGVGAGVDWVPRVGRDRRQICGQRPTGGATTAVAAAPAPRATVAPVTTTTSRPAATTTVTTAPALRSVATTPRPVATQPRPMPQPAAPAACANLPADVRGYFTGPNPRCGPQARHPGDAARGLDQSNAAPTGETVVQVVRYTVDPPAGYRVAWDDDRMNPYRGLAFPGGQRQMEQVWTNTVPRRLVGDPALDGLFAQRNRPTVVVPARLTVIRP